MDFYRQNIVENFGYIFSDLNKAEQVSPIGFRWKSLRAESDWLFIRCIVFPHFSKQTDKLQYCAEIDKRGRNTIAQSPRVPKK